jgi:hypothetical protein
MRVIPAMWSADGSGACSPRSLYRSVDVSRKLMVINVSHPFPAVAVAAYRFA